MTTGTKARIAAFLAWAPSTVLLAGGIVLVPLSLARLPAGGPLTSDDVVGNLVVAVMAAGFAAVGALVALRRPGNAIGWVFCAAGFLWMWQFFATAYATYALLVRPGSVPGGLTLAWVTNWVWGPAIALIVTYVPLLFPHGPPPAGRMRALVWVAGAGAALVAIGGAFLPGRLDDPLAPIENPYALEPAKAALELIVVVGAVCTVAVALASVGRLVLRWRRVHGDEREQIKWLGTAALLLLLATATFDAYPGSVEVQAASVVGIPVATAVAIFRYRLYEIDLIIRRTLVYGVLSALLAGLYFGIVLALQTVTRPITQGSELAVAGSTLAVAALFRPARRRIQALVDRRFYRSKVDAARTLETFSARLRREIDLDTLAAELRSVVGEAMRPAHVPLWLRPEEAAP